MANTRSGYENQCHLVVVNYETVDEICNLLARVHRSWCASILIINHSGEAQARELEALAPSSVEYRVLSQLNNGFGSGVNLGVSTIYELYGGDALVWLVNPDMLLHQGDVDLFLRRYASCDVDLLSCEILTGRAPYQIWYNGGTLNNFSGRVVHVGYGSIPASETRPDIDTVTFVSGASMLFVSSVWMDIGGFDETLFMYWEDVDLSERANRLGYKMGVYHGFRLWHKVGGSVGAVGAGQSRLYYFYSARNRALVMRRGGNTWRHPLSLHALPETLRLSLRPLREEVDKVPKLMCWLGGFMAGLRIPKHEIIELPNPEKPRS